MSAGNCLDEFEVFVEKVLLVILFEIVEVKVIFDNKKRF